MRKAAIGIAINGRHVKIAHVFREKQKLTVDFLESAIFTSDLESKTRKRTSESAEIQPTREKEEDTFSIDNTYEIEEPVEKEAGIRNNADVLYSLLRKFATNKIKVAFNVSPSRVSYQDLDTHLDYDKNAFKGTFRKKIEKWKQGFNAIDNVSVITKRDGTLCNVACETQQHPIIETLEQLNTFFKGNLYLSLMDPNEISLVNLARKSYSFPKFDEITVIVEIETEFSRIIFMKGDDLLTVSPIITEGFSPNINNIIYSKIIYELDNLNINDITNILLAGEASTFTAKTYFEQKFPKVRVGFIVSQPLAENLSTQFSRENLSEYAIPIALAWKVVQNKNKNFIPTNLLPSQIIDRQKVLKLSFASYLLLFLLAITAFSLTAIITAKKLELSSLKKKNLLLEERIDKSEETVKKVHQIDEKIVKLNKSLALSDSLSQGSDRILSLLDKLNQTVSKIKSVWINEIQNTNNGFIVKGMALKRVSVPDIAEALGEAKIKKLTRTEVGSHKIFAFEMEVNWIQEKAQPKFEPEILPPTRNGSVETKIVSSTNTKKGESIISNKNIDANSVIATANSSNQFNSTLSQETKMNDNKLSKKTNHEIAAIDLHKNNKIEDFKYSKKRTIPTSQQPVNRSLHFTIRISAHATKFTANKEVNFYRSKGYEAYITTFPNSSYEIPYWICLGNYDTYSQAEQRLSELHKVVPGNYDIVKISDNTVLSSWSKISTTSGNSLTKKLIKEDIHTTSSASSLTIPKYSISIADKSFNQGKKEPIKEDSQSSTSYTSKHFTIRVSAHATKFTANKEVKFYRSKGYETYITTFPNSSREIPYWVCFGHYDTYSEAKEKIGKLSQVIPRDYDVMSIKE